MRIKDTIHQLECLVQAWDQGKTTLELPKEFRDACEDAVKRFKGQYGQANSFLYAWPQNLLFDAGYDVMEIQRIPAENVETAFSALTDREREVLRMRYVDGLTYEATGKAYGVTRERIRQVESKALRKLRHPRVAQVIREGEDAVRAHRMAKATLLEETAKLNEQVVEVRRHAALLREIMNSGTANSEAVKVVKKYATNLDIDIIEMELSVRAYNCLKRAGFNRIADLVGVSRGDLMKVRNLGARSTNEVIEKLKAWGIEVTDEM